ncbi:MAG: hypothetical protein IPG00_09515 [Saprospiraceae bacterium]|nr:hypothetical protein [Saprospiraceae bacterium]
MTELLSADSLQTTIGTIQPEIKNFQTKGSNGEDVIIPNLKCHRMNIPSSTSSFAQKIFPFKKTLGIAIYGSNILNGRTIYNHIKTIEKGLPNEKYTLDEVEKY